MRAWATLVSGPRVMSVICPGLALHVSMMKSTAVLSRLVARTLSEPLMCRVRVRVRVCGGACGLT